MSQLPFWNIHSNVHLSRLISRSEVASKTNWALKKVVYDYENKKPVELNYPYKFGKGNLPIFRIEKWSNLKKSIQDKSFTLVSPKLWTDPFERLFYINNGIEDQNVYALCFTYDRIESEEAAWNRSLNDTTEYYVRTEYDLEKLCKLLSEHTGYQFYFTVVDYSKSRRELIKLGKNPQINNIEDYIDCLSYKRKAFCYENELRLFVVASHNEPIFKLDKIDIASAIVKITMPPLMPNVHPGVSKSCKYNSLQNTLNAPLKGEISSLFPKTKINQCQLYNLK